MDRDRTLLALADRKLVVPPSLQSEVDGLAGTLHGLVTGATRPMDAYRATAFTIEALRAKKVPDDSIPRLLRLARVKGYLPADAPAIAKALLEIGDSLAAAAQPSLMSAAGAQPSLISAARVTSAEVFYVYINGIQTDFNFWQDTWFYRLPPLVQSAGYADPSRYPVSGFYNPTGNEEDQQDLAAAVCLIRAAEGHMEGAAKVVEKACNDLITAIFPKSDIKEASLQVLARVFNKPSATSTAAELADFLTILVRGARVVVVAHSQGNLFADAAYRELERRGVVNPGCVGTVSVAPPRPVRPLQNGPPVSAQFVAGQRVKDILLQIADIGLLPGLENIVANSNALSAEWDQLANPNPWLAGVGFLVLPLIEGGLKLHSIDDDYLGANKERTIMALQQQTQAVLANCFGGLAFPGVLGVGLAGSPLPPLDVRVLAPNGTVADQATVPITIKLGTNPSGGQLSGSLTVTAVNGIARFSDLVIDKAGSGYTLIATALGGVTTTSAPFIIGVLTAAAPSGLTATATSPTGVDLHWTDNASNEDGFGIERAPSGSTSFTFIATVGPNMTDYANTGLSPGTGYVYRVYAYNAAGNSAFSNVAPATTGAGVLAAPTNLVAIAAGTSSMSLAWSDNSSDEDGFALERALVASGPFVVIATLAANIAAYIDVGLNAGTTYHYRVRATRGGSFSTYSNVASVVAGALPLSIGGAGTGSGNVSSNVGGINCSITAGSTSGNCNASFNSGTSVTLTATPVSGDTFVGWSDACTGTSSCTVSMTQSRSVTASFATGPVNHAISTSSSPSNGGSTSGGGSYTAGSSVTVIASAASGYAFVNWTENGSQVSSSATYTFTASANRSLVANFSANAVLTITGSGTGSGSVSSNVGGINCSITAGNASGTCSASFNSGTSVTLTATPVSGHTFTGWSGACTGTGSCQVTMTQVQSVTASFTAGGSIVFAQVRAGSAHTCGLTSNGVAYCWGSNGSGRLGDGTTQESHVPRPVSGSLTFVAITAGSSHTCASTSTGVAYCWGSNGSGELGDGTTQGSLAPTPVAGNLTFTELTAGDTYTCGITSTGAAYCWGSNGSGQLGDGTTQRRLVPTPVAGGFTFVQLTAAGRGSPPGVHMCGLTNTGAAYCWGTNGGLLSTGQLGDGTMAQGRLVPTPVVGGISFAELTAAVTHTCGRTSAGVAYCWGDNGQGQLGQGGTILRSYVPTPVAGGLSFVAITAGGWGTCGITSGGAAYCWGNNFAGQLGDGTSQARSVPTPVAGALNFNQLTKGAETLLGHTCGRTTDGTAYCWGYNGPGQLGDGTQVGRLVPTPVKSP